MKPNWDKVIVCVVGLGYVGLPLAMAFAKSFRVIGFDVATAIVKKLNKDNSSQKLLITDDPKEISQASFIIICVPTPVTKSKEPDLTYIKSSAKIVGQNMKKGSVIILESTVYPGVTEEIVVPILEKEATLKCGEDFKIAYSPERINPGDEEHAIDKIIKVVAGMDNETTELVAELYSKVAASVFKAKDIRTAEAAKVIENIQRDLNIALINELSLIFDKMGLSTKDVLKAAATKWNFHHYSPGLVGGHCIPVDPYYLVFKAKELGYHPQVILAGRAINDYMPKHVAEMTIKSLNKAGKAIKSSKILIMGLTYKGNVADIRESPVKGIIKDLQEYSVEILGYDPFLSNIRDEFGIKVVSSLEEVPKVDGIIVAVAHEVFKEITLDKLKGVMNASPILIDVRGVFDREEAERKGLYYCSL
ncbi:nucleotide sugar dehydrogenase [Chloroflexota bacterium]